MNIKEWLGIWPVHAHHLATYIARTMGKNKKKNVPNKKWLCRDGSCLVNIKVHLHSLAPKCR